jgi:hypothetical protein
VAPAHAARQVAGGERVEDSRVDVMRAANRYGIAEARRHLADGLGGDRS